MLSKAPSSLKVVELREELSKRHLPTKGKKEELVNRLTEAIEAEKQQAQEESAVEAVVHEQAVDQQLTISKTEEVVSITEVKLDVEPIEDSKEATSTKSVTETTEQLKKESVEQLADLSKKEPKEEPRTQLVEKPVEQLTEQLTEQLIEEPTENPVEQPAEQPIEQLAEKPTEKPVEQPTEQPTEQPAEKQPNEPVLEEQRKESVSVLTEKPMEEDKTEATERTQQQHAVSISDEQDEMHKLDDSNKRKRSSETNDEHEEKRTKKDNSEEALYVKGFIRPLIIRHVQELFSKHGTVKRFWMDMIKTHCYVVYDNASQAKEAFDNVNGIVFPSETGRELSAGYLTQAQAEKLIEHEQSAADKRIKVDWESCISKIKIGESLTSSPIPEAARKIRPTGINQVARQLAQAAEPVTQASREVHIGTRQERPARDLSLDELFKKTNTLPHLYYLPNTDEEAKAIMEKLQHIK
ncbi:hypothetical protein BD560DRAFT_390921 [Blakeslea trispora]|nr:hypothetical protein BD560DRAFT_390921 [Blakeslea trispora]